MGRTVGNTLKGLYYAVFQPSELVAVSGRRTDGGLQEGLREGWQLVVVYLVNLALYAGPLTFAGIGIQDGSGVPSWLAWLAGPDPSRLMVFLAGFLQNSLYLLGVTVATLAGIHIALLVTFQSKGFLRTAHSIVYSTSAYLAAIFTLVWYLTTASGVTAAREFIINLQVAFIYAVIDVLGVDLAFTVARPDQLVVGGFSTVGRYVLVALGVLVVYYLYSLYLGTRINHDAGRFDGVLVVLIVVALPVVYVVGSVAAMAFQQGAFGV